MIEVEPFGANGKIRKAKHAGGVSLKMGLLRARLDTDDLKRRAPERENQAGKPGARPHIENTTSGRALPENSEAVENKMLENFGGSFVSGQTDPLVPAQQLGGEMLEFAAQLAGPLYTGPRSHPREGRFGPLIHELKFCCSTSCSSGTRTLTTIFCRAWLSQSS